MPSAIIDQVRKHQPLFMSNDGVAFYRNLMSYVVNGNYKTTDSLQKQLFADRQGWSAEKIALQDSIEKYEAVADSNQVKVLKGLVSRRRKMFRPELDQIALRQSLLYIRNYTRGPRADLMTVQLMEMWKDNFAFAYPVLIDEIGSSWTKNYVKRKLDLAVQNQQEVNALFKASPAAKPGDNYFIGTPVADLPFNAQLFKLDSISRIETFLSDLRQKFSGKVLLIDIWATWCAPCLSDIPNSKKLHEENGDLPIEYIYICTSNSSDEATWKKRIAALKPPGTHIFMDDALLVSLRRLLHAEGGFPTYVVIDREGKVNTKAISFLSQFDREKLKAATNIQ
ncbi:MAG: TlpA family protein disulfide reductase [Chitinophagaceae bacterium]|nr:MAG: TlpA family protein disulfide reductase [Chitinophagaceae bacterium]